MGFRKYGLNWTHGGAAIKGLNLLKRMDRWICMNICMHVLLSIQYTVTLPRRPPSSGNMLVYFVNNLNQTKLNGFKTNTGTDFLANSHTLHSHNTLSADMG